MEQGHLVGTKLRPPQLQHGLIERANLVRRLREARERKLTLVCAPAGYGKTTLLAQWEAADRDQVPFVWVALDERDSDPVRLWMHLIGGLHQARPSVGERSLAALAGGPRAVVDSVVPVLANELVDAAPLALVLDDWHAVSNRICDQSVALLIEEMPEHHQIVVSSRSDPGFPIARLRAHGDLAEVRERDLRVSPDEAAALFRRAGIRLAKRDVERLTERTEGWLAGLSLTALVVKDQDDPERFVHEFSGDSRYVFDYLARDVLAKVDPATRDFMIRSSILDRMTPTLCDAVLDRTDSAAVLADIDRANLFLISLDATASEYRYHHLFAAVLRRELETADPLSVAELHARASQWHQEQGDLERAIDHAIASRDTARASALVMVAGVPLVSLGRMATVNRWLELLSWPEAHSDRQLAVMRALSARLSGHGRDEVERWLVVAEDGPDFGPLANGISSMRSCVALVSSIYASRGVEDAERSARFVLETEPDGSEWRYAGLVPLGQALCLLGRHEEARAPLDEARKLPGAHRRATTILALAYLSLVELATGDPEEAKRLAERALETASDIGHASSPGAANAHLALGCVLMRGTDLHTALEHLERAVELASVDVASFWHAHALLHLAAARHRLGETEGARAALARAREELDELPDAGALGALYDETSSALDDRPRRDAILGDELSPAEQRVLEQLVQGMSLSEVARTLWLSSNTVKSHRRSIYRKLGASNREELLRRAADAGVLGETTADVHPG